MNQPNKEGQPSAEAGEGRAQTRENIVQPHMRPTQSEKRMSQGLDGVRKAAKERKQERFTALLHHLNVDLLRDSFYALQRKASPGVDGVTWQEYETGLEDRLVDLHSRVHRGAYRAKPSRRVFIPKADGRQRTLGIAALEDKIVQQAVVTILNQIYEVDFNGFSYGFRPGRSPHQALDALTVGIQRKRVNWVLDADIRGFFDNLSHEWTMKFIEHRVADRRILRLIRKWLKAGVSEDGQWSERKLGTPQGAVATPLTQKVISSSNGQLRDGEPGTPCLIFVLNGNILMADGTFMADDALDQSGKGATAECRSWSASTSCCASRSSSTAVPRVRSIRASSISLSGRSLPARASSRNSRRHSTRYIEAPANDGGIGPAARAKQRSEHRSHRNRSVKCLSAYSKKAWLSRIEKAAHCESIFPIHLIACSSRSSRRLTTFWSHVASAPSASA
jgi:retron-type reverse transcriptase